MSILSDKINAYSNEKFSQFKAHYQTLKDGQQPHTLLITCSDSRLCPQEFSQTQAGELFVIRNAGNLMPAYDAENPSNEGLTLEYGISALNIGEIVVCGHASCGAMGGLMAPDKLSALPLVQKALADYRAANLSDVEGKELDDLIVWNVNKQLHSLYEYPFVKERLQSGKLKVYGMVYDFVEGKAAYGSELNANGEVI